MLEKYKRVGYLFLSCCAVLILTGGCQRTPTTQKLAGRAEGTTYHITWWSAKPIDAKVLKVDIVATFTDIDNEISTYQKDSDLQRFNHTSSTVWQEMPQHVVDLLQMAGGVYRASQGCYDPTIKPLYDLWGFQNDSFRIPAAKQIAATRAEVGFDKIDLDISGHRIRKLIPKMSIDLSSMGEGYTAWRLAHVLERAGIENYIVEIGGDMYVKGKRADGGPWRIAIIRPLPQNMSIDKVVTINDVHGVSINTSGTYRHYYDAHGRRYSHIFNPRTGAPVTHDLVSATVFAADPRFSDAWATAMLCLGKKDGEKVARQHHLAVFFIQQHDGKLVESSSPALQNSKAVTIR